MIQRWINHSQSCSICLKLVKIEKKITNKNPTKIFFLLDSLIWLACILLIGFVLSKLYEQYSLSEENINIGNKKVDGIISLS